MSSTIRPRIARRSHHAAATRRGLATVEMAICLPVLIILTLGTMDLCNLFFLREAATLAAYEGAREGVAIGGTNSDSNARVTDFLTQRGITYSGTPASYSSPGFDGADTLENITVTVTIPCNGNMLLPDGLYAGWDVSASVTMRKEYAND